MDPSIQTQPHLPPPPAVRPPSRAPVRARPRRIWINVALLALTFASAVVAQVFQQVEGESFADVASRIVAEPALLTGGVSFAVAVMAILLAHEMGHYLTARRYGVDQTLPYFIPAPTIFGTLGAVILMRSRPQNRRVLLDVAVTGPFAGLVMAVPVAAWGLMHSTPLMGADAGGDGLVFGGSLFGGSLLFSWLRELFAPAAPALELHPVALAGWVGLFVTSINLIPAAQLDGGHVAYALFGRRQERISKVVALALLSLGIVMGMALGTQEGLVWLFWAMLLFIIGVRHPPVADESVRLRLRGRLKGWLALGLFILTFTPVPIRFPEPLDGAPAAQQQPHEQLLRPERAPRRTLDGKPAEEFRL